ncbi:MAG TPA: dipeptidase PepE [Blastocatellia bacterium]
MTKQILLLSNSTVHGGGYLDFAESDIRDLLGNRKQVLFVPFALRDQDGYASRARERFRLIGYEVVSLHCAASMQSAVEEAEAIFIGGGNTFRLLKALYCHDLVNRIRLKGEAGMPYIGASAGSNVACPTIKTTNDMPIVEPPSLNAIGLVPFQVNPHYQDPDPNSKHMGETREERIIQFHEENSTPVIGLREGTLLRVTGDSVVLKGAAPARIFCQGQQPFEIQSGESLRV